MIHYHAYFQDPVLTGAIVTPTSQVRAPAMLLLPIVRNRVIVTKYEAGVASNDIARTKFH
jgi:hypothetical protein